LKALPFFGLVLLSSQAFANDIRFTYVEGGLFTADDQDRFGSGDGYFDSESTDITSLRVRGSVGFGSYFYLPAAIESAVTDYEDEYCSPYSCYTSEYSATEVTLAVGGGLHFDVGDNMAFYGDVSLLSAAWSFDEDGGYDDYDYEDDDVGHQLNLGWRFQPVALIEFDLNLKRQRIFDTTTDYKSVTVQINFTPSIGAGIEARKESYADSYIEREFLGGYFRYSFK